MPDEEDTSAAAFRRLAIRLDAAERKASAIEARYADARREIADLRGQLAASNHAADVLQRDLLGLRAAMRQIERIAVESR